MYYDVSTWTLPNIEHRIMMRGSQLYHCNLWMLVCHYNFLYIIIMFCVYYTMFVLMFSNLLPCGYFCSQINTFDNSRLQMNAPLVYCNWTFSKHRTPHYDARTSTLSVLNCEYWCVINRSCVYIISMFCVYYTTFVLMFSNLLPCGCFRSQINTFHMIINSCQLYIFTYLLVNKYWFTVNGLSPTT